MPEFHKVNSEMHQDLTGGPGAVFKQGNDDMLRQELIRIKTPRLFLGIQGKQPLNTLG